MAVEFSTQSASISNYQAQIDATDKVNNNGTNAVAAKESTVQSFSALAEQPGVMISLLTGQSVMTVNQVRPDLIMPSLSTAVSEQSKDIMSLSGSMNANNVRDLEMVASSVSNALDSELNVEQKVAQPLKDGDANKLERLAATTAALFTSQTAVNAVSAKGTEGSKPASETTATSSVSSATPTRSQEAVEGGTDITAAASNRPTYSKVMGNTNILQLSNDIVTVLTTAENEFNKSSAEASTRAMNSAIQAGNKNIDAAQKNMTGAITGGVMSLAAQAGATATTVKALRNESSSIKNNLGAANRLDVGRNQNQSIINGGADNMLSKGQSLDSSVKGLMDEPHGQFIARSNAYREAHNVTQIDTTKARTMADMGAQMGRASQSMTEGAFGVQAAEESKQADVARADQQVNNEVANVHQQSAKKAAESLAALQRASENTWATNNSTNSAIADRMR